MQMVITGKAMQKVAEDAMLFMTMSGMISL